MKKALAAAAALLALGALSGCSSSDTARQAAGGVACPPFPGFDQVDEVYVGVGQFIPPGEHDPNWDPPEPLDVPQCSLLVFRTGTFPLSFDRPEALQQIGVRTGEDVAYYLVGEPGPLTVYLDWGRGAIPPQTAYLIVGAPA